MVAGQWYPFTAFNFWVAFEGEQANKENNLIIGRFSEVSGLQAETETEDYQEGGVNNYVHRLPKRTKYPNLVLKRGITDSTDLWEWYKSAVVGEIIRRDGSIGLTDSVGFQRRRWTFVQAYPVKWVGPDFKADSNTVAIETLELAHHGLFLPQGKKLSRKIM